MEDIAVSLSFANYQSTLTEQKNILQQTFRDNCVLGYNGGLFLISPEFIAGLAAIPVSSRYVIDMNNNPIYIDNISLFIENASICYKKAVTEYGEEYSKFKSKRSVKALLNL